MYSKARLYVLCKCAVENRLIYGCGDSVKWETLDPITKTVRPIPLRPWEVIVIAGQPSKYFDDKEMGDYLTKLLANSNINCP